MWGQVSLTGPHHRSDANTHDNRSPPGPSQSGQCHRPTFGPYEQVNVQCIPGPSHRPVSLETPPTPEKLVDKSPLLIPIGKPLPREGAVPIPVGRYSGRKLTVSLNRPGPEHRPVSPATPPIPEKTAGRSKTPTFFSFKEGWRRMTKEQQ